MPKATKKTSSKKPQGYIHYHKDGSIWAKGKTKAGKMEGYWEWYRKDGSVMRTGNFTAGKQSGEWKTYDKNGKIVKITHMSKK